MIIENKRTGVKIGEIGIDPEASPGNGQWYVKHYASGYDACGFDDEEEAFEELEAVDNMYVRETNSFISDPVVMQNFYGMN